MKLLMEFVGEALGLASAFVLWLPAWRLSREHLTRDQLADIEAKRSVLAKYAARAREALTKKHANWDPWNHRLLMWGFSLFALSGIVKGGVLLLRG
jgi:hypothetical protein